MGTADILVLNGRLVTFDPGRPSAEALAVKGDRIIAVGSREEIEALKGRGTRVIDAGGASVLPGFTDAHVHLFMGAAELDQLYLGHIEGEEALTRAVRAYAAERPDDRLVYANGALLTLLGPGVPTTRQVLDRVLPDRPFAIMAADHHIVWANTAALEQAGLLDSPGPRLTGEVVAGPDGRASGQINEGPAFAPVLAFSPLGGREILGYSTGRDPDPAPTAAQRALDRETLLRGLRHAARNGITTMHNMDGNFYQLELLAELDAAGAIPCRIEVPFHLRPDDPLDRLAEADEMRRRWNGDRLWSRRVKMFMDGISESRTALMLADYPDTPHNGAGLFEPEHFNEACTRADAMGLQISVHAIGDGAVRRTLDGYEAARKANGARDSRHRIEHVELVHPDDLPRFAELGVLASIQPLHSPAGGFFPAPSPGTTLHDWQKPYYYASRKLRDAGARIVFSTDWPVAPIEVGLSLKAAVEPTSLGAGFEDPRQTLDEALESYTAAAAYAEFNESGKGRLAPGFQADIVVMLQDLHGISGEDLAGARPALTLCGGRTTFES